MNFVNECGICHRNMRSKIWSMIQSWAGYVPGVRGSPVNRGEIMSLELRLLRLLFLSVVILVVKVALLHPADLFPGGL